MNNLIVKRFRASLFPGVASSFMAIMTLIVVPIQRVAAATTIYYDTSNTNGIQDGSAAWDTNITPNFNTSTTSGSSARVTFNTGDFVNFVDPKSGTNGGTVTIAAAGVAPGSVTINSPLATSATPFIFAGGAITSGSIDVQAGTLVMQNAANTYTGGTIVGGSASSATLKLSGTGTLGSTSGTLAVNNLGTLDLNGTSQSVGALNGTSGGTILNNATTTASTLTVGNGNTTGTYNGTIVNNTSGTGTVALAKTGTGSETLTGANTYSGGTQVNGGTLLVNNTTGSGTGTGSVTVNSTGTLGGTGIISGAVSVVSGGTIDAGPKGTAGTSSAVGTLTTGALTLASGSTFHADAFGTNNAINTNWDRLVVNGLATLGSATFTLNIASGLTFIAGTVYTLIDASTISGIFAGMADGTNHTFDGYTFTVHYNAAGSPGDFTLTAVPEPSTWVAGCLAMLALVFTQRRRLRELMLLDIGGTTSTSSH